MIENIVIDIMEAKYIGNYRIQLAFSDGLNRVIDFGPFLRNAAHPDIRKYLDPQKFEGFTIDGGDLVWNDYEPCFPLGYLYEGKI